MPRRQRAPGEETDASAADVEPVSEEASAGEPAAAAGDAPAAPEGAGGPAARAGVALASDGSQASGEEGVEETPPPELVAQETAPLLRPSCRGSQSLRNGSRPRRCRRMRLQLPEARSGSSIQPAPKGDGARHGGRLPRGRHRHLLRRMKLSSAAAPAAKRVRSRSGPFSTSRAMPAASRMPSSSGPTALRTTWPARTA